MRDNDTLPWLQNFAAFACVRVIEEPRKKKKPKHLSPPFCCLYHVIALIFIIESKRPRLSLMTRCLLAARLPRRPRAPRAAMRHPHIFKIRHGSCRAPKTLITCGAFRSSSSYYYTYCSAPLPSIIMNTTMKYDVSAPSPTIITLLFRYRT